MIKIEDLQSTSLRLENDAIENIFHDHKKFSNWQD